jgi:hypothetical protein
MDRKTEGVTMVEGTRKIKIEKHLSLQQKTGAVFIGSVVPKTGSTKN